MKRFLAIALLLGASTVGMVGCDEKSKDEVTEKIKTPTGEVEKKVTVEEKKSGDQKETEKPAAPVETPK
jgi:hypothetical protein